MDICTTVKLNNGVDMPLLGLGTWRSSNDEAALAVAAALKGGYRLIDTASLYRNEAGVGRGLVESGVKRDEVFVTTKIWNSQQWHGRQRAAFEGSLKALGLEYLDLYLIHWPVPGRYMETWKVLEQLYAEGLVRAIGVSNFQAHHLDELLAGANVPPAVNQIEIHPYLSQEPLVAYCRGKGIAVEAWRSMGGGKGTLLEDPAIAAIAKKYGKSSAQVCIRWMLQRGIVVIPKSVHTERIAQNADVYDFALTDADMAALGALNRDLRYGEDPDTIADDPFRMDDGEIPYKD